MEIYDYMGYGFIAIILYVGIMWWFDDSFKDYKPMHKLDPRTQYIFDTKQQIMNCRANGDFAKAIHLQKQLDIFTSPDID